jgi:hypothetical protein
MMMEIAEAKAVICWLRKRRGWPLGAVIEKDPLYFEWLARKADISGDLARAVKLLRNLPETVDRINKAKAARAVAKKSARRVQRRNDRALDDWANR